MKFTIERAVKPESIIINDEAAKRLGAEDVASLRDRVRSMLQERLAKKFRAEAEEALLDKIAASTQPFDIPEGAVKKLKETMCDILEETIGTVDDDGHPELDKLIYADAERAIRNRLIIQKIAKLENLTVEDDEVDVEVASIAKDHGIKASELFKNLSDGDGLKSVQWRILRRKTMEFLMRNANITVVPRERGSGKPEAVVAGTGSDGAAKSGGGTEPAATASADASRGPQEAEGGEQGGAGSSAGDGKDVASDAPAAAPQGTWRGRS